MRQTHTTYRRLRTGVWQRSISLTRPMPDAVIQLLQKLSPPATVATTNTNKS
jgi:hypothetical protein